MNPTTKQQPMVVRDGKKHVQEQIDCMNAFPRMNVLEEEEEVKCAKNQLCVFLFLFFLCVQEVPQHSNIKQDKREYYDSVFVVLLTHSRVQ